MCGIVGYTGKRNSLPVLVDGLKRLEYRGYDSAGIAFQNGNGIEIYKTKGKIKDLQKTLPHPTPDAMVGLGHTRWATHRAPSSRNAHPHRADGIAVVHNGIIENYRNLRSHLIAEGHKFSSDTDTEVIPQMISSYLQKKRPVRDAINYPIALEGALKLKEISYIPATGYPAGEMKHGPIALIEEGLPVVVIAPVDNLFEKTLSNIEEVKARGGRVIAITDEPESLSDKVDDLIVVPSAHSSLSPLVNVIPLQLLAYYIGILKGCDVDQPRNLAKSVTVE
ncbi:MAG: hypothetical protein IEMM0007_1146 [bacterium]|nr:MAG: hypothetical protein IEMM0007_1146 [bacterium]